MKKTSSLLSVTILAAGLALPLVTRAADEDTKPAKPYPLKSCVVSGEKLDEMGKPYVFTHEGQEIKLCCKDCLKDFNKEPEKFLKKIEAAKKAAAAEQSGTDHKH